MTKNRRNLYRILHVQPEAPAEIIKAAYRTLMGPLRQHPDLGGNPEAAAQINRAWDVLSDPAMRAAYDRTLTKGGGRGGAHAAASPASPASAGGGVSRTATAAAPIVPDPANWRADRCCPFCRQPLVTGRRAEPTCGRCSVPLSPVPASEAGRKELFGARAAVRMPKQHEVAIVPAFGASSMRARMRDLSLTGLSVYALAPLPVRQAIRIVDGSIEAVAVVVACRKRDGRYIIHAQLLTVKVVRRPGAFVSVQA